MARPEGLYIPEIQPNHILHARQLQDPYEEVKSEQSLAVRYIDAHIDVLGVAVAASGEQAEALCANCAHMTVGVTYHAMKFASHFPLPTVERAVVDQYFGYIHKDVEETPNIVTFEDLREIVDLFQTQQTEMYKGIRKMPASGTRVAAILGSAILYQLVEAQFTANAA